MLLILEYFLCSEPILEHVQKHKTDDESQEQSEMISILDDDEDLQYVTPPNELVSCKLLLFILERLN